MNSSLNHRNLVELKTWLILLVMCLMMEGKAAIRMIRQPNIERSDAKSTIFTSREAGYE